MIDLNSFEVIQVIDDLKKKDINNYTLREGNDCIWVSVGRVNCYYIFHEGKIADIQVD